MDLTCAMPNCSNQYIRQLFVEGSMKMKENQTSKIDVHCFLFTDVLLICKSINKKSDRVKVIRQPFLVDRIVIQELKDSSGFIVIYLNEYKVASAVFVLFSSETKTWIKYIKKAQEQYKNLKISSITMTYEQDYYHTFDEDEDYDFPSMALLAASPRSSSRSSLIHSHSGSFDTSDPASTSYNSTLLLAPASTPNLLQNPNSQQPPRAVSFELGDLRNPSLTADNFDSFGRSHSVDNRNPPSVTVTSPRPERRAFLLRNAKNSGINPNTLSVNVPYQITTLSPISTCAEHKQSCENLISSTIHVPTLSPSSSINLSSVNRSTQPRPPSPRTLNRFLPLNSNKPPLMKTKNVSGLVITSAPASEGSSPFHSFESEGSTEKFDDLETVVYLTQDELLSTEEQEALKSKLHQKRSCRAEKRYHTADSIENMKKEKDTSIHKRLSWNYGQQGQSQGNKAIPSHCERILCSKHCSKCLSSESVYSSSGFSSTGSVPFSVVSSECEQCGLEILDHIEEQESSDSQTIIQSEGEDSINVMEKDDDNVGCSAKNTKSPTKKPTQVNVNQDSNIKIDISEVRDGISSVQITVNGSNKEKPSKTDLKKMKEFLLSKYNMEAS